MNSSDENILVAIHCVTYNHEPYIRDCLEGFLMQKTNFKFVAIVHDDVSTDKTADIIREYASKYPEIIKPIYETENQYSKFDGSLDRVMETAIAASGAKYVAMCEGDDYWIDPYKLQKQVDYLEQHEDCHLCFTDYKIKDGDKITEPEFASGAFRAHNFEEHLLSRGYIAPMTWIYREKTWCVLNTYRTAIDTSFSMALEFFHYGSVGYLNDCTAVYLELKLKKTG